MSASARSRTLERYSMHLDSWDLGRVGCCIVHEHRRRSCYVSFHLEEASIVEVLHRRVQATSISAAMHPRGRATLTGERDLEVRAKRHDSVAPLQFGWEGEERALEDRVAGAWNEA